MATIPLPALHINPPQPPPDIAEQYGRILALKNQMAEAPLRQQALQQQVQSGQLEVQQKQQALKDQQASSAAMQEWNGDPTALPDLLRKHGASLQTVMGAKQKILETQKQYSDIAHIDAQTGSTQVETMLKKGDLISGAFSTVLQATDAELPQAIVSTAQDLASKGLLDPPHVQMAVQIAQSGDPTKMRAQLETMRKGTMANSQLLTEAKDKAQITNEQAQREQADAAQAETAKYHAQEIGVRRAQLGIEGARLRFDQAKQGTADNAAIEAQAQQIASGDVKAPSLSRNNPYNRALMARVYEMNPKYSDSLYTMTQALRSDKPNSMGGNVGRLGTAILHADNALSNSNNLGFSEGLLTGVATEGTAAYRQDAEFLTGEIGQYVEGGKLTNGQGNDLKKDLFSSRQGVRDSAIKQIIDLSGGKLKSQMEQYKNATQNDFPTDRVFNDPTIKGALQKHGVIGGTSSAGSTVTRYKIVNGQLVAQ